MREYRVTLRDGLETTMQLDEDDAKRLNAVEVETPVESKQEKAAAAPRNKSRAAATKE